MTERGKGVLSTSGPAGAANANAAGAAAAVATAAPAQAATNSRRRMSGTQQLGAHVLQEIDRALHADFPGENRVLILDAEDALVTDVHVGLDDRFPEAGAVSVADGAEGFRGLVEIAGFECEVKDAVFVDVFRKEDGVFHVRMENGTLLSEEVDDLDGIAALPKEMAQVAVRANLFADGLAELHQRPRVINSEIRMHFESQALDAMLAGVLRLFLPIRNNFFFPLPVLHLSVLGGPAVGDPVWLRVLRCAARTPGKANDDFHAEHLREKDGLAESINVLLGVLDVRMERVAVTTEGGDANSLVFKLFLPSHGLAAVSDELVEGTMTVIRVAPGANFHGFETQCADFIEHGIEGEFLVDRVKHPDGNLA